MGVLKEQRLANAQSLSMYFEGPAAILVFNPKIIADGDKLLAHLVARCVTPAPKGLAFFSSFPHDCLHCYP